MGQGDRFALQGHGHGRLGTRLPKALRLPGPGQVCCKIRLEIRHRHALVGPEGPRQAGRNLAQVHPDHLAVLRGPSPALPPQALRLAIILHPRHRLGCSPRQPQVVQRHGVHREEGHCRAALRGHVGDHRPVRQGDPVQPRPAGLDELAHHARRPQAFYDRQRQVRGCGTLRQPAHQFQPDHIRQGHFQRFAQHGRDRLNPPHAPPQHPQPIDHRRVRVRAYQRIGEDLFTAVHGALGHHLRQALQVDLVHDALARRHHPEVIKGLLRPAQQLVALPVALIFPGPVARQGLRPPGEVHLHGVVNHQVSRDLGRDLGRVAPQPGMGRPHGRQIHHQRHAGQVLQQHPPRVEGHRRAVGIPRLPMQDGAGCPFGIRVFVPVAQGVLQQDPQGIGQPV